MLQEFYQMLSTDSARAFYGPGHVRAAHELGAIQKLLITDSLFRVNDVTKRRQYAALVDEVQEGGGLAVMFSGVQAFQSCDAFTWRTSPWLNDHSVDPQLNMQLIQPQVCMHRASS